MVAALPKPRQSGAAYWPWDLLFLALAALYAWLAMDGILPLSGCGAQLDSDLQTYAQGMAGAAHPELFSSDPVLHAASAANSIQNLERWLGSWLAPPGEWAIGLLRAGAAAIFTFYAGWYMLGRWLFGAPSLAALLSVACGITVWVGWGTFWGITHSDPVPRVFFCAAMPLLLWLGMLGARRAALRPIAMLACGLAIWIHGISALNCGAMLFMAFLLIRAPGQSLGSHALNLCACLGAFFAPVLAFLWPSLSQGGRFSADDLAIFRELFNLRWREDYSGFGARLLGFFSPKNAAFPILAGGLIGWIVAILKGSGREKLLARMAPCFLAALLLVAGFSWLEGQWAPGLGRLRMGHELPRGLRLLIPIAWMLAVGGIGALFGKWPRRLALICLLVAVAMLSQDRQYAAAQLAISQRTGLPLPLAQGGEEGASLRRLFEAVKRIVPEGEAIYCPEDAMQTRYIALRPLAHSFKDGYVHFYNKDVERSAKWLELEKLARGAPHGWLKAWQASGAPWLLCRADEAGLFRPDQIKLSQAGWLLVRADG